MIIDVVRRYQTTCVNQATTYATHDRRNSVRTKERYEKLRYIGFGARESKIREVFSCVSLSRCNIRLNRWLRLRLRNNTSDGMRSCCLLHVKIRDLCATFLPLLVISVVLNVFSCSIHTRWNFVGRSKNPRNRKRDQIFMRQSKFRNVARDYTRTR